MAKKGRKKKAGQFVLDCSVTMAWYFKDEANAYAKSVRKSLTEREAVVPGLWPLEVANILVLGERRQRSTEAEASKWLRYLQMLPIRVDDETAARAWSDILHIARSYDLSAYDASYVELAIRLGLPLASRVRAPNGECGKSVSDCPDSHRWETDRDQEEITLGRCRTPGFHSST